MGRAFLIHRVRAQNVATESANKIHDDQVAAKYGFRGGLVPGVTVYGYMMVPIVEMAPEWLERGSMALRLIEPFYDGEEVLVMRCTRSGVNHRVVNPQLADEQIAEVQEEVFQALGWD